MKHVLHVISAVLVCMLISCLCAVVWSIYDHRPLEDIVAIGFYFAVIFLPFILPGIIVHHFLLASLRRKTKIRDWLQNVISVVLMACVYSYLLRSYGSYHHVLGPAGALVPVGAMVLYTWLAVGYWLSETIFFRDEQ